MEQKIIDILNGYLDHFQGEAGDCIPAAAIPDIARSISQALQQNPVSGSLPPSDDFLASDDLFAVDDDVYICTAIVHDDKKIYGRAISSFETSPKEKSFGFAQVTMKWRRL